MSLSQLQYFKEKLQSDHLQLSEELELKYTQHVNALLNQKRMIQREIQLSYNKELEVIDKAIMSCIQQSNQPRQSVDINSISDCNISNVTMINISDVNNNQQISTSPNINRKRSRTQMVEDDIEESKSIYVCGHNASKISAYNTDNGEYLGTIVDANNICGDSLDEQWLTGFDIDDNGAIYVALYNGFLAKYPPNHNQHHVWQKRQNDQNFAQNIQTSLCKYKINSNTDKLCPEGVVLHHQSLFVTAMNPICGILQFDLNGNIVRDIAKGHIKVGWSMNLMPNSNSLVVADGNDLKIMDIQRRRLSKTISIKNTPENVTNCGDFEFFDINNEEMVALSLQKGIVQICHCLNLQKGIVHTLDLNEALKNKNGKNVKKKRRRKREEMFIDESYGITRNDDWFYLTDHGNGKVIRFKCNFELNKLLSGGEIDYNSDMVNVEIFIDDIDRPNLSKILFM